MFIIKWTNKHSGETGYVESVSKKNRHFVNTFEQTSAKQYKTESVASRTIASLAEYGEADNNNFEVVAI